MRQPSCRSLDISPGKLAAVRANLSFSSGEFMVIPAIPPVPAGRKKAPLIRQFVWRPTRSPRLPWMGTAARKRASCFFSTCGPNSLSHWSSSGTIAPRMAARRSERICEHLTWASTLCGCPPIARITTLMRPFGTGAAKRSPLIPAWGRKPPSANEEMPSSPVCKRAERSKTPLSVARSSRGNSARYCVVFTWVSVEANKGNWAIPRRVAGCR